MAQVTAEMVKALRERTGAGLMECKRFLAEADGDADRAVDLMRRAGRAKADDKAGRTAAEGVIALAKDAAGRRLALAEVNCETDFVAREPEFIAFADAVAAAALAAGEGGELLIDGAPAEQRRRDLVAKIGENLQLRRAQAIDIRGDRAGGYLHGRRIGAVVDLAGGDDALAHDLAMHVAAASPACVRPEDLPDEVVRHERSICEAQAAATGKPPAVIEKIVRGKLAKRLAEMSLVEQPFVKDPDTKVGDLLKQGGAEALGFARFEVGEGIEKKREDFAAEVRAQLAAGGD